MYNLSVKFNAWFLSVHSMIILSFAHILLSISGVHITGSQGQPSFRGEQPNVEQPNVLPNVSVLIFVAQSKFVIGQLSLAR